MNYDESLLPSSELAHYVGSGTDMENFKLVGLNAVRQLETLGGLKPSDRVLEIGCGIERIAIPLTQFLTQGSYEGFDVVRHGIEWCENTITLKYPNFHFYWVDLYNKAYNPKSKFLASNYQFPYQVEEFEFIFLTSVFTHMLPLDLKHYINEISRILKKGGTCFFTVFLINPDARKYITISKRRFHNAGEYWVLNLDCHEDGLAYDQALIESWVRSNGFVIRLIRYGHWWATGTGQDIIVITKV